MPELYQPGLYPSDVERSAKHIRSSSSQDLTQDKLSIKAFPLTTRESIELFENAVEAARADEAHKTLDKEASVKALKPTLLALTVDLKKKQLGQIPKEVISIIKHEVERLQLSYNAISQIPLEFTQCSALKYLNLRGNRFKEIPRALLGLPQLEILDISKNRLTEVPDEIERLKALRVLSVQQNDIRDLPYCLGSINTLRMLKVTDNPLNPTLQRIVTGSDNSPSSSPINIKDDNARDIVITQRMTTHMRQYSSSRDSGEDSTSDGPLETPRALSRFPVQPQYSHSTSGSESASDLRSPVFSRPSLPSRSHTRVPSSQYGTLHNAAPRRPGLAPLALGNERNRSNSESVLQMTQNNKVKRMGLVTKKQNDLGVLDETRANRNSFHLRGQSHGSALRNGVHAGDGSPSDAPNGIEVQHGLLGRRLTSLPERQREALPVDSVVDSAESILLSLDMLLTLTSAVAGLFLDTTTKRSSTQRDLDSAAMHIDQLNQELLHLNGSSDPKQGLQLLSRKNLVYAMREIIAIHQRITAAFTRLSRNFVDQTDPRYFRTKLLGLLYGCFNEISNANKIRRLSQSSVIPQKSNLPRVSTISEASNEGDYTYISDRSITPTQHRKFNRRYKNGNISQRSVKDQSLPTPGFQNIVPPSINGRSRSNSRATPLYSSTSSSVISTPRSGESFSSANLYARSRSSSVNAPSEQLFAEDNETIQFNRIFSILSASADEGLAILPQLRANFLQRLDAVNKQHVNPRIRDEWSILANSTIHCLEMTQNLKASLSNLRLNDREARNVRALWQLAKRFLDSYGNLLLAIREAIKHDLIDPNLRHQLRPVHTSTREAARLIAISPWNPLTFDIDPQATPQASTQLQIQYPAQNGYSHRTRGSGGSSAAGGSSPYTNVPATPLSAALGPAAQATIPASNAATAAAPLPPTPASTVPATPGTASLERSFEGDIFQRADTYQSLQQTMIPRRQVH
ncbi:RAM signaling network component [Lecanora helva]